MDFEPRSTFHQAGLTRQNGWSEFDVFARLPPMQMRKCMSSLMLAAAVPMLGQAAESNPLLKEMNAWRLVVERREDLKGLRDNLVSAAAETARKAGLAGKWVFTLHAPSLWPFLQYCGNRDLRKEIFTAYTMRGNHGDATDNKALASRTAALRTEKARLLGYQTWADFNLEENMARTWRCFTWIIIRGRGNAPARGARACAAHGRRAASPSGP